MVAVREEGAKIDTKPQESGVTPSLGSINFTPTGSVSERHGQELPRPKIKPKPPYATKISAEPSSDGVALKNLSPVSQKKTPDREPQPKLTLTTVGLYRHVLGIIARGEKTYKIQCMLDADENTKSCIRDSWGEINKAIKNSDREALYDIFLTIKKNYTEIKVNDEAGLDRLKTMLTAKDYPATRTIRPADHMLSQTVKTIFELRPESKVFLYGDKTKLEGKQLRELADIKVTKPDVFKIRWKKTESSEVEAPKKASIWGTLRIGSVVQAVASRLSGAFDKVRGVESL